ncbi:MAG: DUF1543 domain-containing protein [Flavitalea sp.]
MASVKLFMILIGAELTQRHTEQHDVYFGIGETWKDLIPGMKAFWPDAKKLHVDAWREVTNIDGYGIEVLGKDAPSHDNETGLQLFFLNLGGYKRDEFDEFHYKMVCLGADKAEAIAKAKKTAFYKHTSLPEAGSHIDDKYGIDIDDAYAITEILSKEILLRYRIAVTNNTDNQADKISLGYFKFS